MMSHFFTHRKPLPSRRHFVKKFIISFLGATAILCLSLGLGVFGYWYWGNLKVIDALLNASMILSGMGPVDNMTTNAGKLFSSFYALFSGIAFITTAGVLFGPVLHRFLHRFHIETEGEPEERKPKNLG